MAQITNKYRIVQKVSADDTLLLHPETEAGVVLFDKTKSRLAADNVQTAVEQIEEKVKTLEDSAVTGIKGEKETAYRKGDVNLTAANVGAEPVGTVASHNANGSAHSDIRTAVSAAQTKADSAYALAEGRSRGISFDTVAAMTTALKGAAKTDYKVGDNLLIKAKDVPDYWVSGVLDTNTGTYGFFEIAELETEKVDLSGYQEKTDTSLATTAKTVVGAIGEVKGTADSAKTATQTNSENIAKIVDGTTKVAKAAEADHAAQADKATAADKSDKWTTARNIGVSVGSGTKSDGTTITSSGLQAVDGTADKTIAVTLGDSGVVAGTYSAVQVNAKGIAVAGGQMVEIGSSGQTTPSAALATGGLFFQMI